MTNNEGTTLDVIESVAAIVSAYVSNNSVPHNEVPDLLSAVFGVVTSLAKGQAIAPVAEPPKPAVPVKKSISKDHLICLEDGKSFKSLKRHLRTAYDMTPEEYRAKWGLPKDYPMVAPDYSEKRSQLARDIGLGQAGTTRRPDVKAKTGRGKGTDASPAKAAA